MMLATTGGWERRAFWEIPGSGDNIRYDSVSFRIKYVMTWRRFKEILDVHKMCSQHFPEYKGEFRSLIDFVDA